MIPIILIAIGVAFIVIGYLYSKLRMSGLIGEVQQLARQGYSMEEAMAKLQRDHAIETLFQNCSPWLGGFLIVVGAIWWIVSRFAT